MEIRYLRAFLAICEELHFGRAAARLHIAQPTLSDHLRHLERAVGTRLVDRGPRGVLLTKAGRRFEPAARRGLDELDAAVGLARDAGSGEVGTGEDPAPRRDRPAPRRGPGPARGVRRGVAHRAKPRALPDGVDLVPGRPLP